MLAGIFTAIIFEAGEFLLPFTVALAAFMAAIPPLAVGALPVIRWFDFQDIQVADEIPVRWCNHPINIEFIIDLNSIFWLNPGSKLILFFLL
ncbi:MAG: hypothetical protein IPJ13_31395 [Saprospiraceae bacterium]|nr:hypothetical protein [Saprospiraceae bacterium]